MTLYEEHQWVNCIYNTIAVNPLMSFPLHIEVMVSYVATSYDETSTAYVRI